MKATIFSHGDSSVGIYGNHGDIDTGIEIEDGEREGYRADIAKFFSTLWGEPATVLFEDEEPGELGGIERKKAEKIKTGLKPDLKSGQQLYAKIKRTSKYYGQTERGDLFPVFILTGWDEGYVVQGGPGGQYRLRDVNLYVVEGDREMRIT